jgi:hypothetical protein
MAIEVIRWQSERTGKVFSSKAACSKDENKLDRAKLKKLKERIAKGKSWAPKLGDYIYVPTRMSIDHGEDDVVGGLGQITEIELSMSGGNPKTPFVTVAQTPGHGRNWPWLLEEQAKLMKQFGTKFAYPDPDPSSGLW